LALDQAAWCTCLLPFGQAQAVGCKKLPVAQPSPSGKVQKKLLSTVVFLYIILFIYFAQSTAIQKFSTLLQVF
jgi:hypothetical protein